MRSAERKHLFRFFLCYPTDCLIRDLVQKKFINHQFLSRIEHQTIGRKIIPACTSHFLVVLFYGTWHIHMDDEPNVWLMDSHAKGHCCYHKKAFTIDKFMLRFCPFSI